MKNSEGTIFTITSVILSGLLIWVAFWAKNHPSALNLSSIGNSWLFYIFIGLGAFLLLREIATWYWKINKIINLLEKIEENTRNKTNEKI